VTKTKRASLLLKDETKEQKKECQLADLGKKEVTKTVESYAKVCVLKKKTDV